MKNDKLRNKINNLVYKTALKNNIKILGICHGAHFLAKKNGFTLKYIDSHVGFHKVIFNINKYKFTKTVNSYHNEAIKLKKVKNTNIFGVCADDTIEAFHIKKKKILLIIWHTEIYKKNKYFDKK